MKTGIRATALAAALILGLVNGINWMTSATQPTENATIVPPPLPHATPILELPQSKEVSALRREVVRQVSASFEDKNFLDPSDDDRQRVIHRVNEVLAELAPAIDVAAREEAFRCILNEFFGFGPIQPLLDDPSITEVMVNRANRIYVERAGKPMLTNITFDDDAHVRKIIDRIIVPLGRRLDSKTPLVDARLPDGSRVNAIIPPVSIDGPGMTIRKFGKKAMTVEDLVRFGAFSAPIAEFFKACVRSRLNIIVSGGTGSGKTTLLNVLSSFIPDDERIVTIEDAAELKLGQDHVIRMESRKPDPDGTGEVTIRELVRNALRMRPERIVVGECRGGETLDMLQAMNTGHDGSLTTLHANTPRDAISRIETMSLMGGIDFPIRVIREQVASAVQLIVQQSRLRDGSRKITHITEIVGMEGDKLIQQDLFRYEEQLDANGKSAGTLRTTGQRPHFTPKLEASGFKLPMELFMPGPNAAPRRF
jgi:pilus assembly protein CpaF